MVAAAYNLLLWLLAPAAVPLVALRMRLRGRPWRRVWESLGFPPRSLTQERPGAIWVHAVSVGEALLAAGLVRRLRERFPDRPAIAGVRIAAQATERSGLGAANKAHILKHLR